MSGVALESSKTIWPTTYAPRLRKNPASDHPDLDGTARGAPEDRLEPLHHPPHVASPVPPRPLEARNVEDPVHEGMEIRTRTDGEVDPHRGGALARGLAMVQERVLDRLPHALVRHPARGMDVGEGEVGFVASFDQREVTRLDALPEGLVFGDRRQRLAQAPRERVRADAVHRQSAQAQIERRRGVAPLEGGLREVRDVARLDVVGVELGEDPACDVVGPLVDRFRRRDAARVLRRCGARGDRIRGSEPAVPRTRRLRRRDGRRWRTDVNRPAARGSSG